jgi:hypothetical protein
MEKIMKRAVDTRPEETIREEQQKLWDKVWWNRHMALGEPEAGRNKARALEDKYGKEFLIPKSEIDWGICSPQQHHAVYEEMAWFALGNNVLGGLIRDCIDNDYGGIVLTPDDLGRYRFVDVVHSFPTPDEATVRLYAAMRAAAAQNLRPDPL